MNENNINKINELMANEEFANKIMATESYEKAYPLFVDAGVTATYDEFMEYIESCREELKEKGMTAASGELGEDTLDQVSGGAKPGFGAYALWTAAAVGFIVGGPVGTAVFAGGIILGTAVGTANTLKKNKK